MNYWRKTMSLLRVILDILRGRVDEDTIEIAKSIEDVDIDSVKIVAGGNRYNLDELNKLARENLPGGKPNVRRDNKKR